MPIDVTPAELRALAQMMRESAVVTEQASGVIGAIPTDHIAFGPSDPIASSRASEFQAAWRRCLSETERRLKELATHLDITASEFEVVDGVIGGSLAGLLGSVYVVRPGDTLWAVAQAKYGDGRKWTAIAAANHITDPRKLPIGDKLIIPPDPSALATGQVPVPRTGGAGDSAVVGSAAAIRLEDPNRQRRALTAPSAVGLGLSKGILAPALADGAAAHITSLAHDFGRKGPGGEAITIDQSAELLGTGQPDAVARGQVVHRALAAVGIPGILHEGALPESVGPALARGHRLLALVRTDDAGRAVDIDSPLLHRDAIHHWVQIFGHEPPHYHVMQPIGGYIDRRFLIPEHCDLGTQIEITATAPRDAASPA